MIPSRCNIQSLHDAGPDSYISHIPTPTSGKLFLGSVSSIKDSSKYCIDYIVSMFPVPLQTNVEKHDIFSIFDDAREDTLIKMNYILDAVGFEIYAALMQGKNVLVHCFACISRSSTVVIDCLLRFFPVLFKGEKNANIPYTVPTVLNALRYVQHYRNVVEPNEGFMNVILSRYVGR